MAIRSNLSSGIAFVGVIASMVCAASPAHADTTLRYRVSQDNSEVPMVVRTRPGEVRVEGGTVGGRFDRMVYRSEDNTVYAMDPAQKVYLALDPAAIEQIARRVDEMRADLREQLKEMPVGQRKFVKSQIGDFLKVPEDGPARMKVETTGGEARVNDVACLEARMVANGQPAGRLCVASADILGLTSAEFQAYQGLYRIINDLQTAMSGAAMNAPDIAALSGVPVRMHLESSGMTQTLQEVAHSALPDKLFEIPEDYQRQEPRDLLN